MPDGPLFEIDSISLRMHAGEMVALTGPTIRWTGLDREPMRLHGDDASKWSPDLQLGAGLFVTEGRPAAIPGVRVLDLSHRIGVERGASSIGASERGASIARWSSWLGLGPQMLQRPLDSDFSPSEAMAIELLQLAMIRPDVAVFDLTARRVDGPILDEQGCATLQSGLHRIRVDHPDLAVLVVTDLHALVDDLAPDRVHHWHNHRESIHPLTDPTDVQADRDEVLL